MAKKQQVASTQKPSAKKRTLNDGSGAKTRGAPMNDQDVKRRLGNFEGAGEPPRRGGREKGIVGQRIGKSSTDKKSSG